jgi:hypothetical protein
MKVAAFEKSETPVYGSPHCATSDLNLHVLCFVMVFFNNNFGLLGIAVFM